MSNVIIKVEFLAGTDIFAAVTEAKALAESLSVAYVQFMFNGIKLNIGKDADTKDVVSRYHNREKFIVDHHNGRNNYEASDEN
jgi:hypothetical protein